MRPFRHATAALSTTRKFCFQPLFRAHAHAAFAKHVQHKHNSTKVENADHDKFREADRVQGSANAGQVEGKATAANGRQELEISADDTAQYTPLPRIARESSPEHMRWQNISHELVTYGPLHSKRQDTLRPPREHRQKFLDVMRYVRQRFPGSPMDRNLLAAAMQEFCVETSTEKGEPAIHWLMLQTMLYAPIAVEPLLLALVSLGAKLDSDVVADIIYYLARLPDHSYGGIEVTSNDWLHARYILKMIKELLPNLEANRLFLNAGAIDHLLRNCGSKYGVQLSDLISRGKIRTTAEGDMWLARYFYDFGDYASALGVMQRVVARDHRLDIGMIRIGLKMLRKSLVNSPTSTTRATVVSTLQELGVISKTPFFTLTQRVGMRLLERQRGWYFMKAISRGEDLSARGYAEYIMSLRDSVDQHELSQAIPLARAKLEETRDVRLGTELLYWHYYQHQRKAWLNSREYQWEEYDYVVAENHIREIYQQTFDAVPLFYLGLDIGARKPGEALQRLNIRPDFVSVNIVLIARLRLLMRQKDKARAADETLQLWHRWWNLVRREEDGLDYDDVEPWVLRLFNMAAQSPVPYTAFIHALGNHLSTLPHAVMILQHLKGQELRFQEWEQTVDWMHDMPEMEQVYLPDKQTRPLRPPRPDLITYTALMNSFARHGEPVAAEHLMGVIQAKNITPDAIAWNALIKAYAIANDPLGVIDVLQRKYAAGFSWDHGALVATRKLKMPQHQIRTLLRDAAARQPIIPDWTPADPNLAEMKPFYAPDSAEQMSKEYSSFFGTDGPLSNLIADGRSVDISRDASQVPKTFQERIQGRRADRRNDADELEDWFENDDEDTWGGGAAGKQDVASEDRRDQTG